MSTEREMLLLVRGAKQVVRVSGSGERVKLREAMSDLAIVEGNEKEGVSIAVDMNGRIAKIGLDSEVCDMYKDVTWISQVDVNGGCVIPGFVDAHTHPVWAGDRVNEFALKVRGASYMEVHSSGGGINYTVQETRTASEDTLLNLLIPRLQRMLRAGTTLVECKSGYGLDVDTEMKMLRVLHKAIPLTQLTLSSTFLGAHSVPKGVSAEEATKNVIEEQLPKVIEANKKGEITVESMDVFCEAGVFNVEQSHRILEAGKKAGLRLNFHADELHPLGGAEMGAKLGAEAISHLEEINDKGISEMARMGSVAVLLPTTAHVLRLPNPPARKMIDAGVPVALGSDFNPNAHCMSMPVVMYLACVMLRMSPNEVLTAATLHSAHALARAHTHGSLEGTKMADMVVIDAPRWEHVIYQLGGAGHVIKHVIKEGKVVYTRPY